MATSDVYVSFGAETGDLEAGLGVARAQMNDLTKQMRELSSEFVKTGATADSDLGRQLQSLGAQLQEAKQHSAEMAASLRDSNKDVDAVGKTAGEAKEGLDRLKDALLKLAALAGISFGFEAFKSWVDSSTEAAEKLVANAAKIGFSFQQMQTLSGISQLMGGGADAFSASLSTMQTELKKGENASDNFKAALKALGIAEADLKGTSPTAQLETVAQALSQFSDGASKTAAATALLGSSAADLIPYLDRGAQGVRDFEAAAARAGGTLGDEAVLGMAKTQEHIRELSMAMRTNVFEVINPAIDAAVVQITRMVESLTSAQIRAGVTEISDDIIDLVASISAFAARAADDLGGLQKAIDATVAAYKFLVQWIPAANNTRNDGLKIALGQMTEQEHMYRYALQTFGGGLTDSFSGLQHNFDRITETAKAAHDAVHNLLAPQPFLAGEYAPKPDNPFVRPGGPSGPQVPTMDTGKDDKGGNEAAGVEKAFSDAVTAAQDAEQQTRATLDGMLQTHALTMSEWLTQTTAALDHEQDAIQDAADKALASDALTAERKIALANREDHEISAIVKKMTEDQNKAADEVSKKWDTAFKTINGAFEGQVDGLIRGTTSWSTAFKNVLTSLTEDVVKMFLKWGLEAMENLAKHQLMNAGILASTVTTEAGATAAHAAGAAAQKAADQPAIMSDAARAAAGAYASTAGIPIIGPILAPGAAALAFGAVEAFGAFDIGAWNLPHDQMGMVHKNELIMPAPEAAAFRSMLTGAASGGSGGAGAGGGGVIHNHNWNVSAIDSGSVRDWLHDNKEHLASALHSAVTGGNSHALKMLSGR